MGVLGALVRSLENPEQPLTSTALAEWLSGGPTAAGVPVSERRVYGLPAYYRGIALLSGTMGGLPLHVYHNGTRERVSQRTVLDSPNPRQTPFEFWQSTYAHAISWGNGFSRKVRDGAGIVREVWPLHPSRVRVEEVDRSELNPEGKLFLVTTKEGEVRRTAWDIAHFPYLSLDGVCGIRPLQLFRENFGIAVAAERTQAKLFGNGNRLSGVLKTDRSLKDGSAERLKARWREKHSGPDSAGDIAVLDNGLEFQPISIPPADAQMLESRKFTVTEIARMLGLPPHLMGDVEKSTSWGTGIEQQNIGLVVFVLGQWLKLFEQRVTREFLPGGSTAGSWYAEYSVEGLLRGDSAARAGFYDSLIRNGIIVGNEARALENLEPMEGGDERLLPAGVVPASLAETKVKIDALGALVRAGFEPASAAAALGLDPIDHTGLVPITVTPLEVSGGSAGS